MKAEDIIKEYPKGALIWYEFKKNSKTLLVKTDNEQNNNSLIELLSKKCAIVDSIKVEELILNKDKYSAHYDYIIAIGSIQLAENINEFIKNCVAMLNTHGHIILGVDNRLGVRFFCGERDPYTNRSFDGIEHYHHISDRDSKYIKGRCYSLEEIKSAVKAGGQFNTRCYSVFPNLNEAQLIYGEDYLPNEDLSVRYFPSYEYPESVFMEEEYMLSDLAKNGMFHAMANSYIIDICDNSDYDKILHVTLSLDRGKDNAMVTIIKDENGKKIVCKKSLYGSDSKKVKELKDNLDSLKSRDINVIDSWIENDALVMPYSEQETATEYLIEMAKTDKDIFIKSMDDIKNLILNSSSHVGEDKELGVILEKGYMDLVHLNCFHSIENGKNVFTFYDQEFVVDNIPANIIIYRNIELLYWKAKSEIEKYVPKTFFIERYNIKNIDKLKKTESEFFETLRNEKILAGYITKHRCNSRMLSTNRQKLNYSPKEYNDICVDIFKGAENKKIILFGAGMFAERFLVQFKRDYEVFAIVDNNAKRWGSQLRNVPIIAPDNLKKMDFGEIKIIICMKECMGAIHQLADIGIEQYCIYNPEIEYSRKETILTDSKSGVYIKKSDNANLHQKKEKPYNVGYVAGVFDLFHIGHLNMFKRAKEQCKYLIVGVVSDEGVRINKKTDPFVPFEERIEMVKACSYVDEVVEIPFNYCGIIDAYNMYHFDVQFSGSDYINDPQWLADKEYLEKNGSTIVFFPYTESTSSTKLKKMINDKMI